MEKDHIKVVSYASIMDNLKYIMLYAKLDICFTVRMMSGY